MSVENRGFSKDAKRLGWGKGQSQVVRPIPKQKHPLYPVYPDSAGVFCLYKKEFRVGWGKIVFITKEASMPLPKNKFAQYRKYYRIESTLIREFDNGTKHPVVLMHNRHAGEPDHPWMDLLCKCDLTFEWNMFGIPKKRTMIHTGDGHNCPAKKDARDLVCEEVRIAYVGLWAGMTLADSVLDIWQKHSLGEYLGEHNPGTLYVQDIESLLGTTPEVINIHLCEGRNEQGEVVSPRRVESISFPSKEILAAIGELKKRKLVDLNGMILVPYREYFRFPEELHRQFAYWIEVPLGWPNGEAGDCFLAELYEKITGVTGWRSGEDVFGAENIPAFAAHWRGRCTENWLPILDWRFGLPKEDHHDALRGISTPKWIAWLVMIRKEIRAGVQSE